MFNGGIGGEFAPFDGRFKDPDYATVSGMITAFHFSDHHGPEVHFILSTGEVAMTDGGWRIMSEVLDTVGHSVLPQHAE